MKYEKVVYYVAVGVTHKMKMKKKENTQRRLISVR